MEIEAVLLNKITDNKRCQLQNTIHKALQERKRSTINGISSEA
jgi:hypothetical protein